MKVSYIWSWTLVVVSLMIGGHMLFTMSPVINEYNKAVEQAKIVEEKGSSKNGKVLITYDYTDTPNMGSPYGADVVYTSLEHDSIREAAWIALDSPVEVGEVIKILHTPEILNFALNFEHPVLPHEKPDMTPFVLAITFITIPILYIIYEIYLALNAHLRKVPQKYKPATVVAPTVGFLLGGVILFRGLIVVFFSLMLLSEYMDAGQRVQSVRAQENIVVATLNEECMDRSYDCNERYEAYYEIDGESYSRYFHVKGDILEKNDPSVTRSKMKVIPLLYNENDPRFSYALSSSKQVEDPYDTFEFILHGGLMAAGITLISVEFFQRHRKGFGRRRRGANEPESFEQFLSKHDRLDELNK